jgi:LAS superfamily LD-carboxypeptidase LdcB
MNRREFVGLALGSLVSVNQLFAKNSSGFDIKIVTGRKQPALVGINERLQKEASADFKKMQTAALKENIRLFSTSSYRSFDSQLRIWNGKYDRYQKQGLKGKEIISKIIEYSAFPGASRHHWGTDLDIYDINVKQPKDPLNPKHYKGSGIYNKMYSWMQENSEKYGFYEVYTDDPKRKGFKFEPWHYSYKSISKNYLETYLTVDFEKDIQSNLIKGHKLIDLDFWNNYVENYVKGINPVLL